MGGRVVTTKVTKYSLSLTTSQWEVIHQYVATQAPLEACGLLAGKNGVVEAVLPVENAARSPVRFRMEPHAQLKAFQHIEISGQELLAIFHSHPKGLSIPSHTDMKEAAYPVIHMIWSLQDQKWEARGFWIEDGHAVEVPINVQSV